MAKAKSFFIAAADSRAGMTSVATGLLYAAAERGLSTAAVKPVATGCDDAGHTEGALLLQQVMTEDLVYQQVNPVALEPAIAPHIAAAEAGRRLTASQLAGYCRGVMMSGSDLVVVEGAGGWRTPINQRETFANLAMELNIPVILVVNMREGCINNGMLSAEVIRRDGLRLAAWVANSNAEAMPYYQENLSILKDQIPAPLLGEVPHLTGPNPRSIAGYLDLNILL
jgi:dethiobiotin synthetase